ncbi:MAG: KGK family protein [Microcoleus sp. PH2017_22_RUC_O_B]|uniref:KGK domain-containing protein n=1 Tax=unclassified Microcoleus TaxID=2642155 RepID=UPI001D68710C|nr:MULTISPECIES: KGK domain-containing protein [unclassified Microcoleus]MCC3530939.1 KGK family protein [Microcoleus sp. PH2017_21_RUC_O_A]MCC3543275.1 KGK family protein [Microcoleus sp. PH2017_22_RUC_O_B]
MNENIEANQKKYETLDGADDVLLLNNKDTFTVQRFKELVGIKFDRILGLYVESESGREYIRLSMQNLSIDEEIKIGGGDINWNSREEGMSCQVLKVGSKGWKKGKIKIEVNHNLQSYKTQVSIKFCPDELREEKSPLDDIRQSEEYKKLSNNN